MDGELQCAKAEHQLCSKSEVFPAVGNQKYGGIMRKLFAVMIAALIVCLASAPAAKAGTVSLTLNSGVTPNTTTFTISGTFASNVPTTSLSIPGGTYSFSFTLATNPTLTECIPCNGSNPPAVFPGQFDTAAGIFQMDIASTSFTLNGGTTMVFNTPFVIQFDTFTSGPNGNPGGFLMCFDDGSTCGTDWVIVGQQLFTGSVSNPTFISGAAQVNQGMSGYQINGSGPFPFGATPEPSSIFLLGTGLLGLGFAMRRKLHLV